MRQGKMLCAGVLILLFIGCSKNAGNGTNSGGYTQGTPDGTLAGFDVIPIPTVDLANQVIPNLNQFFVTNRGPYVQIVKGVD